MGVEFFMTGVQAGRRKIIIRLVKAMILLIPIPTFMCGLPIARVSKQIQRTEVDGTISGWRSENQAKSFRNAQRNPGDSIQ